MICTYPISYKKSLQFAQSIYFSVSYDNYNKQRLLL